MCSHFIRTSWFYVFRHSLLFSFQSLNQSSKFEIDRQFFSCVFLVIVIMVHCLVSVLKQWLKIKLKNPTWFTNSRLFRWHSCDPCDWHLCCFLLFYFFFVLPHLQRCYFGALCYSIKIRPMVCLVCQNDPNKYPHVTGWECECVETIALISLPNPINRHSEEKDTTKWDNSISTCQKWQPQSES